MCIRDSLEGIEERELEPDGRRSEVEKPRPPARSRLHEFKAHVGKYRLVQHVAETWATVTQPLRAKGSVR